jgi:hypothetical protein
MAMRPCEKCLEECWGQFERIDGWVRATCQSCGHEIEWKPFKEFRPSHFSQSPVKITEEGQMCRRCQTPVVRREHKTPPKYKAGSYYFEHWFACTDRMCNALYMVEDAKVWFDGPPPTFKESLKVQPTIAEQFMQNANIISQHYIGRPVFAVTDDDGAPPWD